MNTRTLRSLTVLAALAVAPLARAQELTALRAAPAPARNGAWEIGVGFDYLRGNGGLTGSGATEFDHLGPDGLGLDATFGVRLTPRWEVGIYGSAGRFAASSALPAGTSSWLLAAGVQGQLHFAPADRLDPWIGLGAGWTGRWLAMNAGNDSRHGFELARLQLGIDWRASPGVSITPLVGAAFSTLLTESLAGGDGFHPVADPKVHAVVYGGIQGRFDWGGSRPTLLASR